MKREILCLACGLAFVEVMDVAQRADFVGGETCEPYPGEFVKQVGGRAVSGAFVCDHCNRPIEKDMHVMALSMWTSSRPYVEWESDYLFPAVEPDPGSVLTREDGSTVEIAPVAEVPRP